MDAATHPDWGSACPDLSGTTGGDLAAAARRHLAVASRAWSTGLHAGILMTAGAAVAQAAVPRFVIEQRTVERDDDDLVAVIGVRGDLALVYVCHGEGEMRDMTVLDEYTRSLHLVPVIDGAVRIGEKALRVSRIVGQSFVRPAVDPVWRCQMIADAIVGIIVDDVILTSAVPNHRIFGEAVRGLDVRRRPRIQMVLPVRINAGDVRGRLLSLCIRIRGPLDFVGAEYAGSTERNDAVALDELEVTVGSRHQADVRLQMAVGARGNAVPVYGGVALVHPWTIERIRREDRKRHDFADVEAIRAVGKLACRHIVTFVRILTVGAVVVSVAPVRVRTERRRIAHGVKSVRPEPAVVSGGSIVPPAAEQMVLAVSGSDDLAVPV